MSTYSGYDPSECGVPPQRSCFQALISGPTAKSTMSQGTGSYSEEKPDRNNSYGLLHNQSAFPFEDSFFSAGTGMTDSTSAGGKKKVRNKVNVMSSCTRKNNDRRRGGGSSGGNGGNGSGHDATDARTTVSRNSHRGLLDAGGSSYVSNSGGSNGFDILDKKDALTWKTSKTATNSSVASSSHRSRMSRKSGAFPTGYDSFDFVEVDDIQRRSLGKTFIGCVSLKKMKNNNNTNHNLREKHNSRDTDRNGSRNTDKNRNRNRNRNTDGGKHGNGNGNADEPIPPIPGSPQFFKFHNAKPSHTVQNTDFPQIIFANETPADDHGYFGNEYNDNERNNEFRSSRNGRNMGMNMNMDTNALTINTTDEGLTPDMQRYKSSRLPSPVRRSSTSRKSFDFSNASPSARSKSSRSRGSRNPSPRSIRSRKEEEQFLDSLANAFSAYNTYQKEGGRNVLNRLMSEVEPAHIPDVVDVGGGSGDYDCYDDDISEVGMASTSGGGLRKDASKDDITPTKLDYHVERRSRDTNDYFDPTINRGKRQNGNNRGRDEDNHNGGDDIPSKFMNVDERSLKWRLREADKQNSTKLLNAATAQACPSREFMETGKSLMDRDASQSTEFMDTHECLMDQDTSQSSVEGGNQHQDDEVDPTYAFGGSGIRKPPLALSEAFEDFGIDDRIYAKQYRPGDTFDDDDEGRNDPRRYFLQEQGKSSQPLNSDENRLPSPNANRRRSPRNKDLADETRRANLMNRYITNHHQLDSENDYDDVEDLKVKASPKHSVTGNDLNDKAKLMNKYITNHHEQIREQDYNGDKDLKLQLKTPAKKTFQQPGVPLAKTRSNPRSSKYREINGAAYFSEAGGSTSNSQTSKWPSKSVSDHGAAGPIGKLPTIYNEGDTKNDRRQSPQSIAEFGQW
jgi:hypothetical protein